MKLVPILASTITMFALGGCGHEAASSRPARQNQPAQQQQQDNAESSAGDTNTQTQDIEKSAGDVSTVTMYRQAQSLMRANKYEKGYEAAKKAMAQFVAEDNDLAWMLLESITINGRRIDVHFNMGPSEREPPDNGIVKPLSFRVWSTGDDAGILEILDFEIGRFGGASMTAAIGKTDDTGHGNFGILPIDASYVVIRKAVLDVVNRAKGDDK